MFVAHSQALNCCYSFCHLCTTASSIGCVHVTGMYSTVPTSLHAVNGLNSNKAALTIDVSWFVCCSCVPMLPQHKVFAHKQRTKQPQPASTAAQSHLLLLQQGKEQVSIHTVSTSNSMQSPHRMQATQVPIAICSCSHRARTLHPGSTQSRHSVRTHVPGALHRLLASARHSRRITSLPAQAPTQQLVTGHGAAAHQVRLVKPADTTA